MTLTTSRAKPLLSWIVTISLLINNIIIYHVRVVTSIETRPGIIKAKTQKIQTRIIGGNDANEGRFPYMVSLLTQGSKHTCGGSLVAPDIVLTAAHCSDVLKFAHVGRWNRNNRQDNYEIFSVVREILHPLYDKDLFPYDFMLLKLNGQSTMPIVEMNNNGAVPSPGDDLTVIGFGYTRPGDSLSEAGILQQVDVSYIPNEVCALAKDPNFQEDYQGLITPDMICASDKGEDSCQGDSGGPLVLQGATREQDILLGVVSWGFGCALQSFPGVYSRISDQLPWIRSTICAISDNPPPGLECNQFQCDDLEQRATGDINTIPVKIYLQFDGFRAETGWSILDKECDSIVVERPPTTYEAALPDRIEETVFLRAGRTYTFKIEDTFGDGLCCDPPGNYKVILGRKEDGPVLLAGGGDFGFSEKKDFELPAEYNDPGDDELDLVLEEGEIILTVFIQLDKFPQEVGWRIDRLGLEVGEVIRVPAGIYVTPEQTITKVLVLEEGDLYFFSIYDVIEDGIDNGSVKLFLGTTDTTDDSHLILEKDGAFGGGFDFSFVASFQDEETLAPLMSESFLTLELRMDLYPEEIGLQLRASNTEIAAERQMEDTVIFFRPARHYKDFVDEVVLERIPIPNTTPGASRQYTFIITDSYGDGLCCNWVGQVESGYTLYKGDKENGDVIATSRFEGSAREVTGFTIVGEEMNSLPSQPPDAGSTIPIPTVEVKLTITLDVFPDETGFYIADLAGNKVFEVVAGTYREQNQVVEEVFSLEIGTYALTIVDVFGDGLNLENSYYALTINGDENRPALVHGSGSFLSEDRQVFVLEGPSATYPVTIRFSTDAKPTEFGFQVKRLDLIQSDAYVVDVPIGTYKKSYNDMAVSFRVQQGGLYRIVFEDSGNNGISGLINILLGTTNPGDKGARSFTLDGNDFQELQFKFFAGELPEPSRLGHELNLRVLMDRFPHEFEWVLLGNSMALSSSTTSDVRAIQEHSVINYGPKGLYPQDIASSEYVETIELPPFAGEVPFVLIITDSAGDGVCCTYGVGGPVELFEGSIEEGNLLFTDPFEGEDRLIKSFSLIGEGTYPPSETPPTESSAPTIDVSYSFIIGILLMGTLSVLDYFLL